MTSLPPVSAPTARAAPAAIDGRALGAVAAPGVDLLRGAFAYGGRQAAMTVLGVAGNLLLTRLLLPHHFGQIAAITVVAGVMRVFAIGGIGLFLIQRAGDVSDDELSAVRTIQFVLFAVVQLMVVAAALLAPWLGMDAELWWIIACSASGLVFGVLRSGSTVLLERRLAFGRLARIDVAEQLVNTTVMIALAATGFGAWSVAIAAITAALVAWRLSWRAAPFVYRPQWPRLTPAFRRGLRFSAQMIAPSVLGAVRLAALPIVVGALAGLHATGLAERAVYLATAPFALLGGIQQRILFTYTARIQHDRAAVGRVFHDAAYVSSIVDKLIYLPFVAFAPAVVSVLFSDRWLAIVPAMQLVAGGCALFGAFFSCAGPILTGLGRAHVMVRVNVLMLALTWISIVPLTLWLGPLGYGFVMVLMWTTAPYVFRQLRSEIGRVDLLHTAVLPGAAFIITVLVLRTVTERWAPVSNLSALLAFSAVGAVLYVGLLAFIDGGRLRRHARALLNSTRISIGYGAVES